MILTNGCSYTAAGENWPDAFAKYGYTFYDNFNKEKNYDIVNIGAGGAGNTLIRRKTFHALNGVKYKDDIDYAIIQWSTIDRWDYPISFMSEDDAPLIKLNLHNDDWVGKVGYTRNGTSLEGKSKIFYENLYSKYGQLLNTLDDIYYTQLFLENLGIPYLMFSIANFLTTEASFDMIKSIGDIKGDLQKQKINKLEIEKLMNYSEESDSLEIIKKKINWDKFIWSSDFKIDNIGDGFTEYLINKGEPFKQTGNHPDETQHTNFFNDIIYPKFISEINSI